MTTEELKSIESLCWEAARDLLVKAHDMTPLDGSEHTLTTAIFAATQSAVVASNIARESSMKLERATAI